MKQKTCYICSNCGYESSKWIGKCPSCEEWDTFSEHIKLPESKVSVSKTYFDTAAIKPLKDLPSGSGKRISTGISEFDLVLGGGLVEGSVVLAGGEPGIGKSTLMLQAAENFSAANKVLYISGEESAQQVKLRAKRLKLAADMLFFAETAMDKIMAAIENLEPKIVILDSIQTVHHPDISSSPGSISQVRECASMLTRLAKTKGVSVFLIGHVTKEGNIAGPRQLEHLVDTVLYFEGERTGPLRILRAVKNRFGSTNEIGVFEMGELGMIAVENPSALMLTADTGSPGSSVYCALEGTRPMLLLIEALVCESKLPNPRRVVTGYDFNRLSLITAVLEKKIGLKLYNQDIFVNVSGGIKLAEPAADLAVASAIVSAFRERPVAQGTIFFGEVGLTGQVRHVSQADKRLLEAERMGMIKAVVPKGSKPARAGKIKIVEVGSLFDGLSEVF